MGMDQQKFDEILQTFQLELEERLQDISECLLKLENIDVNTPEFTHILEKLFRAAHNIKGTARSLGLQNIGEIAHHLESVFAALQQNKMYLSKDLTDFCLKTCDIMREILIGVIQHSQEEYPVDDIIARFQNGDFKPIIHSTSEPPQKDPFMKNKDHESIRVSIQNLDKMFSSVEEIQITKIAFDKQYRDFLFLHQQFKTLHQLWQQMKSHFLDKSTNDNFNKLVTNISDHLENSQNFSFTLKKDIHYRINQLDLLTNELQDEMRNLRLLPAQVFLQYLPRAVRDIATELNKPVEFTMTGENVKIDKFIIEEIQSPIIHLLRNAIDHGIESRETRFKNNKPEIGHISLSILEEGDKIIIKISDDGQGINIHEMTKLALEKNLLTEKELKTLTHDEMIDLIFLPGFSSKQNVTDVSGRGIGLDIVKSSIIKLKGEIKVLTELHSGTTFELRLPLTLTSERGLLITCGNQRFAIPTHEIECVLMASAANIICIESKNTILINERPLLLQNLAAILNIETKNDMTNTQFPVVVIKDSIGTVAFQVDGINNEREIIIKTIHSPMENLPGITGGTLSETGEVILVLNPFELLQKALRFENTINVLEHIKHEPVENRPHILVVDDSITTRTLQKNILENHHFIVTTANNGKAALELLKKQPFALLITDINMPEMDGFTLTEQVKRSSQLKNLPVIIVTSLGSETEKKRGMEVGADAYVVKNEFESQKLLQIVDQLV